MASPYRHEPLITASLITAAANLAILRTHAASGIRKLVPNEYTAAIRVAIQPERLVQGERHNKQARSVIRGALGESDFNENANGFD